MTRNELIDLVKDILDVETKTEKEIDQLLDILKQNVPDPEVSDLIYWNDLSPEEIIDKALTYKPIQL
ncbi:bacteriocin immunity protein [Maribacter polysiphoniae]|uniref:Bacteriocin immunity protein n=1 Tax=Maribacter polysiphoniae TaxID=429344 RepID=A0A316DTE1_9FLAO|nr:bacteriocin immunity protein [Maribacter polysiphoniae]MBD1262559.1 bacteriocin immunity protein [Maribacter polysiphoniae]PWK21245.1 colicin immunity protein/pyocin immunity protein [Maribacter polysiphoniae]